MVKRTEKYKSYLSLAITGETECWCETCKDFTLHKVGTPWKSGDCYDCEDEDGFNYGIVTSRDVEREGEKYKKEGCDVSATRGRKAWLIRQTHALKIGDSNSPPVITDGQIEAIEKENIISRDIEGEQYEL